MVKDEYRGDEEEVWEEADYRIGGGKGIGGDVFGPPTPGIRYECEVHGLLLPRDIEEWGPDGLQPLCPYCSAPLSPE